MVKAIIWEPSSPHQSGEFVARNALSVLRPKTLRLAHRREDLQGFVCAHWTVIKNEELQSECRGGYWWAHCDSCGLDQEIRLDSSVVYVPVCKNCDAREPRVDVGILRNRFLAWKKGLRSSP